MPKGPAARVGDSVAPPPPPPPTADRHRRVIGIINPPGGGRRLPFPASSPTPSRPSSNLVQEAKMY